MKIRISGVENDSIVDGPGFRFTIFVQGCPHNCAGCHNPQTHDFKGGKIEDTDNLLEKIKENPLLSGVTFSGGEPFCQAKPLAHLAKQIKQLGLDIIIYTGYIYEDLIKNSTPDNGYQDLIDEASYIIDGPFLKDKKSYELKFKGSSNQRIIDCKKTKLQGEVVTAEL